MNEESIQCLKDRIDYLEDENEANVKFLMERIRELEDAEGVHSYTYRLAYYWLAGGPIHWREVRNVLRNALYAADQGEYAQMIDERHKMEEKWER